LEDLQTIAIFGGSFDPPHTGHVKIVSEALKTLPITKLFIVPTYLNPFKDTAHANADTRFLWLKKLFTCNKVEILDYEVKQHRPVPTIETVKYLLQTYKIQKIFLIIGTDNYKNIHKWDKYEELTSLVEFVVATRQNVNLPENLKKLAINVNISSSKLREKMDTTFIPKIIENEIKKYYQGK
jgi:nicotinate-nucleotide adenylyltransferase